MAALPPRPIPTYSALLNALREENPTFTINNKNRIPAHSSKATLLYYALSHDLITKSEYQELVFTVPFRVHPTMLFTEPTHITLTVHEDDGIAVPELNFSKDMADEIKNLSEDAVKRIEFLKGHEPFVKDKDYEANCTLKGDNEMLLLCVKGMFPREHYLVVDFKKMGTLARPQATTSTQSIMPDNPHHSPALEAKIFEILKEQNPTFDITNILLPNYTSKASLLSHALSKNLITKAEFEELVFTIPFEVIPFEVIPSFPEHPKTITLSIHEDAGTAVPELNLNKDLERMVPMLFESAVKMIEFTDGYKPFGVKGTKFEYPSVFDSRCIFEPGYETLLVSAKDSMGEARFVVVYGEFGGMSRPAMHAEEIERANLQPDIYGGPLRN